jgi:rfaE bifunctional protein nucleotidyltransferase chain/domain
VSGEILTLHEAILRFRREKRNGRRVVFTNGCFDLLHPGHVELLEKARKLGEALIVAVNCDPVVRQLKGKGRPIWPADERAEVLASFECVDAVIIFEQPTPREVISALLPDVLVKGGDWPLDKIVGREEVEASGGKVISVPIVSGYSTTGVISKIRMPVPQGETAPK